MLKKILISGAFSTLILFVHPCFAFFCCGDDDGLTAPLNINTGKLENQNIEIFCGTTSNAPFEQAREYAAQTPGASVQRQVEKIGDFLIEFPPSLVIVNKEDGTRLLTLEGIFYLKIFPSYDDACEIDKFVKGMHRLPVAIKSKKDLERRIDLFFNIARNSVDEKDRAATEEVINCIQIILDSIPEQGPFPVKFAAEGLSGSHYVLFRIEDGALLIELKTK